MLLQDWAPTQAFLDELRASLLFAGVGGFVLALAGGLFFSHRTSQPLMDMAAAARDIAGGDWSRTVPARGSAEATTMANAFNDMTRSLRDQAERLNASYLRFSTVTQSARDAIISTDGSGNITFWNRSAEATFGYSEAEVLGRPITMLIVESDRAAYKAALPDPNADDLTFGHIIEVTGLRKDGSRFPCEFSLAALQGREGTAFTAVVRDVIERKQSQDTLQQREEQLRQAQKMEAIGRLAGGVAHDFNNLLMAIHGYAEMLIHNLAPGDERRTDAEEIVKAADRAAGLTRQLLAFSSRQVITQQAVALDQLVQNMQNMLQRLIGPEIQISTEVWPDLTPVLADTTQVEQILVNLVINARDAMPGGGKITHRAAERRARQDRRGGASRACSPATTSRCRSPTPARAWTRKRCRGSSSRSSRRRKTARARGWGSPRCTASCSRTTAPSKCTAASGTARRSTFICRARPTSASPRRCRGERRRPAAKRFCSSKTTIACARSCRTC